MALIPYFEPFYVGTGPINAVNQIPYPVAQNGIWRRGGFLINQTTGTGGSAKLPQASSSTLLNVAGPVGQSVTVTSTAAQTLVTNGNTVTITGVVSAAAPAASYYVELSFTAAGPIESLVSNEFIVNCAAGFIFSVNVSAAGAPATAANYAVYVGIYPGGEL